MPVLCVGQQLIAERLDRQRYEFPQEKIHLFTDRGNYLAGDTIWLRAWVVDAGTHAPVNASRFLYVDLLAPNDSVMHRVKLHSGDDGVFQGYFPLQLELPEGRYQLLAYTMFMQSVGTDYFYRQNVEVQSLSSLRQRIVSRCVRHGSEVDVVLRYEDAQTGELLPFKQVSYFDDIKQRWSEHHGDSHGKEVSFTLKGKEAALAAIVVQFDNYSKFVALPPLQEAKVDFYPEGGYLVPGVENVMTFKMHGAAALRGGVLVGPDGRDVGPLTVEHDGMGLVRFVPEAGATYTARWTDEFAQPVDFAVPVPRADATVVQVRGAGSGRVQVQAVGARADSALLVVQQRGRLLAAAVGALQLDERDLEPGVVQAMAFDGRWHCMSERLFFARGEMASPEVATQRPAYASRERVEVSVDLGRLAAGATNFAVSVTDDKAATRSEGNIYANLLLQSDLRGRINKPDYYFASADSVPVAVRQRHLDMLLLTQGWRRYDVQRVMQGRLAAPKFPIEQSQVVAGRVLSEWRKKPVVGADVSLIAPRIAYSNKTVTDSLGEFTIAMPLLPDSVECLVMAENVKGQKQMNLELDPESFPQLYYAHVAADGENNAMVNAREEQSWRLERSGDWRHIVLSELLVTAPHRRLSESARDAFTLNAQNIVNRGINSVEGFTYALPGIMVYNGNLYTPGGQDRDRVSIVVDGEPVRADYSSEMDFLDEILHYMSPIEREKQSRIYYPSGASFSKSYQVSEITIAESMISFKDLDYVHFTRGPRGHGGVLVIEHKKGFKGKNGEPNRYLKIAHPVGAQQPAEYYTPVYENGDDCGNAPGTDLRTVLYWNPCVAVDSGGRSTFDFYTNDASTTYTITLEGITSSGTPFRATQNIENQAK